MIIKKYSKLVTFIIVEIFFQSCMTKPPESPDNICLIFKEKKSWYKAVMRAEKRWKVPPYVLMSFVYQESSFIADARPEREKLLGFIPWFRPSTAVGYSQALYMTWDDYKDETGNSRASRKDFERTDARSLYLAYHEGYGGFKKKTYRKKQWLVKVADRVQARSTKYQQQYWGCAKELKKKRFFFF